MTKCKKPTPYDPKLIAAQCNPLALRLGCAAGCWKGENFKQCGRPPVAIRRWMRTDGPDCEDMPETGWYGPVCKTHANHDVVPLAVILDVMTGVSEEQRGRRMMDECERLTYVSGEAACNAVDIATALGGGFHVSFPPGRGTMTLIKYFPDGSDVSIEVGDDRAAASNSRFETVEWDIEDGIPQKLVDMLHPKAG